MVVNVDEESWEGEVLKPGKLVVVDFYSHYCPGTLNLAYLNLKTW